MKVYFLLTVFVVSILTNFIWENLHSPLYEGYNKSLKKVKYSVCTVMDGFIILSIYLILYLIYGDFFWVKEITGKSLTLTVVLGGVAAIIIEKIALSVNLWQYNNKMPKLPIIKVGFLPTLQLMVLPIISYFVSYLLIDIFIN